MSSVERSLEPSKAQSKRCLPHKSSGFAPTPPPHSPLPTPHSPLPMSFDYDLVIIGGSLVARSVAAKAGRLKSRVALVEPEGSQSSFVDLWCQVGGQMRTALSAGSVGAEPGQNGTQQWRAWLQTSQKRTTELFNNEDVFPSHAQLAAAGVDVVVGEGLFERQRRTTRSPQDFALVVNERILRSKAYLLAMGSIPTAPAIAGIEAVDYRTIDSLWQNPWSTLPDRLVIVGSDPRGLVLAQQLNYLGTQVTWVTPHRQIVAAVDREGAFLLQAVLEAAGIDILTETTMTQVTTSGSNALELHLGTHRLTADALLLATDRYPNLAALNLGAIGVQHHRKGIAVNTQLQTTQPRVYACGEGLGGYVLANFAHHEAEVALHNALFFPKKSVHYRAIPWMIPTDPPLVQVGLTEHQARRFTRDVRVLRQSYQPLLMAHLQPDAIGFCQVVVRSDGEILGAQGMGANAPEWINLIALAMQRRIKLGAIDPSMCLSPSFSEVLARLVDQWKTDRRLMKAGNGWKS
ncbi:FAD-dependent oxidoreductase [Egbenema bharatensis]|uniref:FAD-dependent oxidoreductase n=1 Tax=Egbenema bharatensis TaxID=3463334 RepID=UPI003A893DA5